MQNHPRDEIHFVIDDTTIAKTGKMIENVSYIYDHNIGRSVLGFCIVTLGLMTGCGFYPTDFAYRFGKKAKCYTKSELVVMMIERAVDYGILPGYVLSDSRYAWPCFINKIRNITDKGIHVICRLKNGDI
ncbi:transposase [Desulfococcaceae bacterium HSG7]|nr:transposase [Desulfococcaceae bacterium HSG7]